MVGVKTWKNAVICMFLASLLIIAMVAIGTLCPNCNNIIRLDNLVLLKEGLSFSKDSLISECNFFSGKWVHDNISYPLYKEGQCSLMNDRYFTTCGKYGRKDLNYQNWRWQPHQCDIPRFNGTALLEKIRGKKLVFVGDSLSRNQWKSMLCLIESFLPPSPLKSRESQVKLKGNLYTFHATEYNATIGFYWAPLLVESNCDEPLYHSVIQTRIVRIESIEKHGRHWIDADILVFSSFTWWTHFMTILWGSFESPDSIYKEVSNDLRLYEIALNTWSEWLEMHIERSKTKMFFMSHSPIHFGDRKREKFHCYNQTEPIFDETYWPSSIKRVMMEILESTIEKLEQRGLKVEYLNITQLSGYRRDAHPTIYHQYSYNKSNDPYVYSDCVHWCLPGVPDIWNQILYAYIMKF